MDWKNKPDLPLSQKFKTNKGVFLVTGIQFSEGERIGCYINAVQNVGRTDPYYLSDKIAMEKEKQGTIINI